jgi:hypothetical protein
LPSAGNRRTAKVFAVRYKAEADGIVPWRRSFASRLRQAVNGRVAVYRQTAKKDDVIGGSSWRHSLPPGGSYLRRLEADGITIYFAVCFALRRRHNHLLCRLLCLRQTA